MSESLRSPEPQDPSRERYFDKTLEFFHAFNVLDGAINRATRDKDSKTFLRFNLAKVRIVNDFAWMQACEDAGIHANTFTALLGKKQDRKIAEERIRYYDAIKEFSEEPLGEEPLEKKYLEISQKLSTVREGIEEAKQQDDGTKYLELRRVREALHSDFEWMETFREAGMSHEQIVDLYTKKEDRQNAPERAAFDEIIRGSERQD